VRHIRKYKDFVVEISNSNKLLPNGPGEKLQRMLDNNLESIITDMSDDNYRITIQIAADFDKYNTSKKLDKYTNKYDPNEGLISVDEFEKEATKLNGSKYSCIFINFVKIIPYTDDDFKLKSTELNTKLKKISNEEFNKHKSILEYSQKDVIEAQHPSLCAKGFKLTYVIRSI